jgi:hypothetical protein
MLYCFCSRESVLKNHDVIIRSEWMLLIRVFSILNVQTITYEKPIILHGCTDLYFSRKEEQRLRMLEKSIYWRQKIISIPNENVFYKSAIGRILHRFSTTADVSFPRLSLGRSTTGRYCYCLCYVRYSSMSSYSCTEQIPFTSRAHLRFILRKNVTLLRLLLTTLRPKRWMWNDSQKERRKVLRPFLYKIFSPERRINPKRIGRKRIK